MDELSPVFVCLKWGKAYPTLHTNVLFRALSATMTRPFRMVCLTDDAAGLDAGIEVLPLPDMPIGGDLWAPGMWPKLAAFRAGLFAPGTPVMLIDVDVMVMRNLGPMFDRIIARGGLHIVHDWPTTHERWLPWLFPNRRMSNSSVVGFIAGAQDHLWEMFSQSDWATLAPYGNDQTYIHMHASERHFWPARWVRSFKKSLAWHVPLNLVLRVPRPHHAYIVAFHGRPDIEELAGRPGERWGKGEKFGYFPVGWIKDYWQRFT